MARNLEVKCADDEYQMEKTTMKTEKSRWSGIRKKRTQRRCEWDKKNGPQQRLKYSTPVRFYLFTYCRNTATLCLSFHFLLRCPFASVFCGRASAWMHSLYATDRREKCWARTIADYDHLSHTAQLPLPPSSSPSLSPSPSSPMCQCTQPVH